VSLVIAIAAVIVSALTVIVVVSESHFDWDELAVRAGCHVAASQHAGKLVRGRLELQARTSASPRSSASTMAMGDQSAQQGVSVLGIAQVTGTVQGVQARHGQAGRVADVVQPCRGFRRSASVPRTGARLRREARPLPSCAGWPVRRASSGPRRRGSRGTFRAVATAVPFVPSPRTDPGEPDGGRHRLGHLGPYCGPPVDRQAVFTREQSFTAVGCLAATTRHLAHPATTGDCATC